MTPEVEAKILRTIRLGLHPERAALAQGVAASTMRAHRRRDKDFASAVKEAEAEAEGGFLSRIIKHTEKQWTACAWILERRWPERWAKREPALSKDNELEMQRKLRDFVRQASEASAGNPSAGVPTDAE